MGYFIIIRGPLGCGKTTISRKLATKLKADIIFIDEVLEGLNVDIVDEKEGCIPVKNFVKANKSILSNVRNKLNSNKIVIFDACFYHKKVIEHLIENLDFPHYIFTLKAPVEICIKRDKERKKTYGEGAAYAVHSLVSQFDYGNIIDVTGTIDDAIKDILSYLP